MKKILLFSIIFFITNLFVNAQGRRIEVLFLGDKGHHKPIERVPSLMAAVGPKGINITYTEDLTDITPINLAKYDALIIYANIDSISKFTEKAILDFVASGKGFLPIHCASYCFRNSPDYIKLVGGQFWRHTMDSVSTQTTQANHPIMKDLAAFTVFDETYLHSKLESDNNILATREIKSDQFKDKPNTKTEPYTWTRTHGKGKVFYTALGHDERTWQNAVFLDMIYRAILWSINDEAKASLMARNPAQMLYREANLPNYEKRPSAQMQQLPLSPEESMKHIQIPVDFKLELFAAEPNVMHPIAMTWDERGRLFVLITKDYPNERKKEGGKDYILLCEDENGDGKADKFTKWADGLSIPTGLVFANGGLIVSQAPDMLFLIDTNNDNKADERKILFTGFGTFDTHAGPSNLHYGFDNWIWGCVGYSGFNGRTSASDSLKFGQAFFRFMPDGSKIEWMTTTNNNTWGMAFNETNDVFGSTANNAHGWYMAIPHSFINSKNNVDNGSRSIDTHKDMKPITDKVRQVDAFGGFTAAAGHNFYTARAFPKKYWNNIAFVAEPTGHVLHQNMTTKRGTDYIDNESFNLMAGSDEWFSPVFAETGPDGAVWVADWYSYIIQHNPVPTNFKNGDGNAYDTDLRDFTHGRIYRVAYKNAPAYKPLDLSVANNTELVNTLSNTNMFWRLQAQRLLIEKNAKETIPALISLLKANKQDEIGLNLPAIHAIWVLKGLGAFDVTTQNIALANPNSEVKKNALRAMDYNENATSSILKFNLLNDKDLKVVMQSLLVLSKSPMNALAENAFFERLNKSTETTDRWLPDAFVTVLTANEGKLLKKHLNSQIKKSKIVKKTDMGMIDMNHNNHKAKEMVNGKDLVIENIHLNPADPAARERTMVSVEVRNMGSVDIPAGTVIPLDLTFEGPNLKIDQVSENFKDGIKLGETVKITKGTNGPWTGDLGFNTDIAGDYNLKVVLDKNKTITGENNLNNLKTQKITFSAPANMNSYVLERALRSYASFASADSVASIIKKSQKVARKDKNSIYKGLAEGWNYKAKNVEISEVNKTFLKPLALENNAKLNQLLSAWKVIETPKLEGEVKTVLIKAVREAMKYDVTEFTVKAGQTVELIFENPDAMQHNLVIVKPNTMEKVGLASDKMMMDAEGADKNYVPALSEVLFASPLVTPDNTYKLIFKAPETAGNYPYVCTFPGHWRLMNGVMKVVK
jgi:uncharacterized protein